MERTWETWLPRVVRRRLENREDVRKIVGNSGWLFGDKIIRLGVGMLVNVWVTRYLGPQQFGVLNYAIAFVALFSVFSTLGLDGIVVRELVNRPEERQNILGSAMFLKACGSILTIVSSLLTIAVVRADSPAIAIMVAVVAFSSFFQSLDVLDYWFQSRVESKYSVIARNTAFFLVSALRIGLILAHAPLIAFAAAWTAEFVFSAVALAIVYASTGHSLVKMRAAKEECFRLLGLGWPLMLSTLSVIIYMKIDQVMLGQMMDDAAVGIYSAAAKLSEIWYFIPTVVVSSVFPSIVEIRRSDEAFYYRRLQRLFRMMSALSLSVAVPVALLSGPVVTLLYGKAFAAAGPILAVHIWASLFVFLGVAQTAWDLAENYTRLSMMRTAAGALINVILNILLIPRLGAMGAAVATVFSYASASCFLNIISPKTRTIFILQLKSLLFFRNAQHL